MNTDICPHSQYGYCRACVRVLRSEIQREYIQRLPANWFEDSSLETWFPMTAETLKELQRDKERLDWLDERRIEGTTMALPRWYWELIPPACGSERGKKQQHRSLRSAIDAAIQQP